LDTKGFLRFVFWETEGSLGMSFRNTEGFLRNVFQKYWRLSATWTVFVSA